MMLGATAPASVSLLAVRSDTYDVAVPAEYVVTVEPAQGFVSEGLVDVDDLLGFTKARGDDAGRVVVLVGSRANLCLRTYGKLELVSARAKDLLPMPSLLQAAGVFSHVLVREGTPSLLLLSIPGLESLVERWSRSSPEPRLEAPSSASDLEN